MANVTYLFKKVRNNSGWSGWTQLGGQTVDYVSTSTFCVVYGVGLSMEGSETLNSLSVSTNFVAPASSDNPTTANCYLYTSDPTTSGATSPPSGYVASATQSFSASAAGKYVTFNFSGLSIPSTTMVYVWFTSSVQHSSYGNNQIYHYATGNGNTQTPAAYISTSGGSSSGGGTGNTGSGGNGQIYNINIRGAEGITSTTGSGNWYDGTTVVIIAKLEYGYKFDGFYKYDPTAVGGYGELLSDIPNMVVEVHSNLDIVPKTSKVTEAELRKVKIIPHSDLDLSRAKYGYYPIEGSSTDIDNWTNFEDSCEFSVYDNTVITIYIEQGASSMGLMNWGFISNGEVTISRNDQDDTGGYRTWGSRSFTVFGDDVIVFTNFNLGASRGQYGEYELNTVAGSGISSTSSKDRGFASYYGLSKYETVALFATPLDNYLFSGWYINNQLVSTDNPCVIEVMGDTTVEARGTVAKNISVSCGDGVYSVAGGGQYLANDSCTLTASIKDQYIFDGWYSGSTRVSTSNPYTFIVTGDKTLTAKATVKKYTVTANRGTGISSTSGGGSYEYGAVCTVSAVTQSGYEFQGWYDSNNVLITTDKSYAFNVVDNIKLTAKGVGVMNYCTVNVEGGEGIASVSGTGIYSYITGETAPSCSVSATVENGYIFSAWYTADSNGNPSSYVSSANPYTFKAQNINLVAVAAKLYTVTVIKDEGISSSATTAQYGYGKSVSFQASAASGYGPVWYKNGTLVLKGASYTFSVVEDTTIEIKSEKMYSVSVTKDAGISSVSGDTYYYANQSCVLSASVNTGYNFNGWYENNALVTDLPTYTFTVTADRQFSALTAIKEYTITPVISTGVTYVAGGGVFTHGQECTVSAIVEPGYVFYGWFVDGALFSNSNPATFAVTKDILLEAVATVEIIDTSWDLDTREKWIYSGESESITRAFDRNTVICVPFILGPNCITEQTVIIESISSMDLIGYLSTSSDFDNDKGKPVDFLIIDDDSGDNGNFKIEYTVAPGVDYYIWSRPYASDKSGSVTLSVELKSSNEPSEPDIPDIPEIPDIPIVPEVPVIQTESRKYYTTKIYTGGSWQTVIPYIFENGQWVRMTSVIYHEEEQ